MLTLTRLSVDRSERKTEFEAVFEVGGSLIRKSCGVYSRREPSASEVRYLIGKAAWEAIQDATHAKHGDTYREHLPSEAEYERATLAVLKRAEELQPNYFTR